MAKLNDVIKQLQSQIPRLTDDFNDINQIVSATINGGVMTLVLEDDNIQDSYVNVFNLMGKLSATGVTAGTEANTYDIGFSGKHDQTYSDEEKEYGDTRYVEFIGDFSERCILVDVPSVTGITIESDTAPSGTFSILEDRGYNGRKAVTWTNTKTLKYTVGGTAEAYAPSGYVQSNIRIDGVSSPEDVADYIENEAMPLEKNTLFVVLNGNRASKSREIYSDSYGRKEFKDDLFTEVIQTFSVFAVIPTQDNITPRTAINYCDTLLAYLIKCLQGAQFDDCFGEEGKFLCSYLSDNGTQYNKSYYVHRYDFEVVFNIENKNALDIQDTRAFRDFELGIKLEFDDYTDAKKTIVEDID